MYNNQTFIRTDDEIRQGDLFKWYAPTNQNVDFQWSVVLTADCDFANSKTTGIVAHIPVVSASSYIRDIWPSERIIEIENELKNEYDILDDICDDISYNYLYDWVSDAGFETVHEKLKSFSPGKKLELIIDFIRTKISFKNEFDLNGISKIYSIIYENNSSRRLKNDIKNRLKNPRSDCFPLNEIPGEGKLGYFCLLRHLDTCDQGILTTNALERRNLSDSDTLCAERIGRLDNITKYALSQSFSYLYSRIGMPSEFEDFHKMIIDDIICDVSSAIDGGTNA